MRAISAGLSLCFALIASPLWAQVQVTDDIEKKVTLPRFAQRIVTTSPHALELVIAAGGKSKIVGQSQYGHQLHPIAGAEIVNHHSHLDVEKVLQLSPDLLIVWRYGLPEKQIALLQESGIPVFYSDPQKLDDIAHNLDRIGRLIGTHEKAKKKAASIQKKIKALRQTYANQAAMRVFWQVSGQPLYTLNGRHMVSEVIELCGGVNVFAQMKPIAPLVGVEDVLLRNPEVIVASSLQSQKAIEAQWNRYHFMAAVQQGNIYQISPDLLSRPSPNMIYGIKYLCEILESARHKMNKARELD